MIKGFSKLSKDAKIEWLITNHFKADESVREVLETYLHPDEKRQKLHDEFIENTLTGQRYLCADELTLADTVALPYFHACQATSMQFDNYPAIQRWYSDAVSRPAFQRALAQMPE